MLIGVLRAPHDPTDYFGMCQLIDRAKQAADHIEQLEAERDKLREFLEDGGIDSAAVLACDVDQEWCDQLEACRAERDRLRREVNALRWYGNKDCTAQADEALAAGMEIPPHDH
jgi:hypothetical protein